MGQFTLSQGRLFGALYESILYGINCVLFLATLYLFVKQTSRTLYQRIRLGCICVIFALCTVHLAAVMRGLRLAFFQSNSPDNFFNDHTQPVDLVQKSVYAAATFLGDSLLVHRLYVVFGHNWVAIILPSISLSATTALWIALIHTYHQSTPGTTLHFPVVIRLLPGAFATTFVTNTLITGMIAVRIKLAMRAIRHFERPKSDTFYRRFMAYTVESGLLYPTTLLATGLLYFFGNNALEILSGSNTQVIGIVPMLLALQLRMDLSIYDAAVKQRSSDSGMVSTMRFGPSSATSEQHSDPHDIDVELATSNQEKRQEQDSSQSFSDFQASDSVPSVALEAY